MRAPGFEKRTAGRSLLVVEDDCDIRDALDGLLKTEGYAVATCSNGAEALDYLRHAPKPDVIVLDLMMPVMDGWQFRVEQKRDPSLASIPVLALSADATPKAAAIDAEAYLKKPVDYETLIETIDRLIVRLEHRELQSRLAQTDRLMALGTLAAGVAHEINNPLAYVLLNVGFLAEEVPRLLAGGAHDNPGSSGRVEQVKVAIEHVRDGAERIRQIVRGLKTFSRPEDESLAPIDVRPVMDASIGMVENEIRHRARLLKQYEAVPRVIGNEARLGQVFLNLLLNALQALPDDGGDRNEIRVRIRAAGNEAVVIEVQDTGAGIPPQVRGRIFEPFFTTKPVGIGTGLGLSICHGIVTGLGGQLTVDSELGRGSVFCVELPVARTGPARAEVAPPASEHEATRGRVLVVDDEPIICFTLERLLASQHDVIAVTDARDALARIDAGERFDVVLCDLMMPGVSGPELYRAIRERDRGQADRIVFVTGGAFTEQVQRFLTGVSNPRVDKPFDVPALLELVRATVKNKGPRAS
jgi:signal transduction histidine kinase